MEIRLVRTSIEPIIKFYDGISLAEYRKLNERWSEILLNVQKEIWKYINDDNLCFKDELELFPNRNKLSGDYYIDSVSYVKHVGPLGFKIIISARLTEKLGNSEEDYLGLEVTLFVKSEKDDFEVLGIDSSCI